MHEMMDSQLVKQRREGVMRETSVRTLPSHPLGRTREEAGWPREAVSPGRLASAVVRGRASIRDRAPMRAPDEGRAGLDSTSLVSA
jgi:hypothetical protein